jgi:hypothetical protein
LSQQDTKKSGNQIIQAVLCLWIVLCIFIWCVIATNSSIQYYPYPRIIKTTFQSTYDALRPYIYRQSIFDEKLSE